MTQTREHLAIPELLRVKHGIVALTKTDLIDDTEWLELMGLDVVRQVQAEMVRRVATHTERQGTITVGVAGDLFDSSRPYTARLLESLDEQRVIRRVGGERVLRSPVAHTSP